MLISKMFLVTGNDVSVFSLDVVYTTSVHKLFSVASVFS